MPLKCQKYLGLKYLCDLRSVFRICLLKKSVVDYSFANDRYHDSYVAYAKASFKHRGLVVELTDELNFFYYHYYNRLKKLSSIID